MNTIMAEEQALTIEETAKRLSLSEVTVARMFRDGDIPGYKIGGSWRIDRVDLENYIGEQKQKQKNKKKK